MEMLETVTNDDYNGNTVQLYGNKYVTRTSPLMKSFIALKQAS